MLSDKDPIKTPLLYSGQVMVIHVFEHSYGFFQVGQDFGRVWEKYRKANGNFHKQHATVFQGEGASGPSTGCGCSEPEDFLDEFIRNYSSCPHAD